MAVYGLLEILPWVNKIYENIRPTLGKIVNKPWDDIDHVDSNWEMHKKDLNSCYKQKTMPAF